MRGLDQKPGDQEEAAQPQVHVEPSAELKKLARTVVSDEASAASEGVGGTTIDLPHREKMEKRFGRSFADVRVHVDPKAASGVGARAYTLGRDIVFATPHPDEELVAHELTHVVQQSGGKAGSVAGDEAQAQSVAAGGQAPAAAPAAEKAPGAGAPAAEAAPQQELRKDAILDASKIKAAISYNNGHWKDPHRGEILKTLRGGDAADSEFQEDDVVKIAKMQQAEGLDGKSVDGALGPTSMAIMLRQGLHLSAVKAKAEDVQLVFYPGEFEDLGAWQAAREKAKKDANGDREREFQMLYQYVPKGHGTIYVKHKGNVVDSIQARGGPPFTMHDRGHTADPSKAGTYKLGAGKSVITKSWSTSQIAWGAPIREHGGEIQFKNPGQDWQYATGKSAVTKDLSRDDFLDEAGNIVPTWRKNDFGETGFRVEGSPGLYVHTGPETEEALKQECDVQGKDEQHIVHEQMELTHSHGCLHVDPYDRNRWMRTGYLQKGVTMVIKKYEESLDPAATNKKK